VNKIDDKGICHYCNSIILKDESSITFHYMKKFDTHDPDKSKHIAHVNCYMYAKERGDV